jgi:hypothetical protein
MKLTKADTARHLGISRQTLYEWIRHGRISVNQDGTIDSAEVARLSGTVSQPDIMAERHGGQVVTSPSPDTLDVYREMVAVLKAELEESRRREAHYRTQVDRLTDILDRRLLESPRQVAVATVPGPQQRSPAIPESWQRIIDYLQKQDGAVTAGQVQEALGLPTAARHVLNRMVRKGLLERVEPGVYKTSDSP